VISGRCQTSFSLERTTKLHGRRVTNRALICSFRNCWQRQAFSARNANGKGSRMSWIRVLTCIAVSLMVSPPVLGADWTVYHIAATGTSVDFPSSIFTEPSGRTDGYGQTFRTSDGRADFTIKAIPNAANDTPAAFLAKMVPPPHIQYKRVTPRFFAVSSYKGDKVWYNRCNFSGQMAHCVLINYPASEERDWDKVVTRISLSLRGG